MVIVRRVPVGFVHWFVMVFVARCIRCSAVLRWPDLVVLQLGVVIFRCLRPWRVLKSRVLVVSIRHVNTLLSETGKGNRQVSQVFWTGEFNSAYWVRYTLD